METLFVSIFFVKFRKLLMADKATDSANTEQLSISVRFFDGGSREKFLGFVLCESGVTGEAIAENILLQLETWQLPPSLLTQVV